MVHRFRFSLQSERLLVYILISLVLHGIVIYSLNRSVSFKITPPVLEQYATIIARFIDTPEEEVSPLPEESPPPAAEAGETEPAESREIESDAEEKIQTEPRAETKTPPPDTPEVMAEQPRPETQAVPDTISLPAVEVADEAAVKIQETEELLPEPASLVEVQPIVEPVLVIEPEIGLPDIPEVVMEQPVEIEISAETEEPIEDNTGGGLFKPVGALDDDSVSDTTQNRASSYDRERIAALAGDSGNSGSGREVPFADISVGARTPEPGYPPQAKRFGQEGTVLVEIVISREGKVEDVYKVKSSGHILLDDAALKVITRRWKFQPQPSEVRTRYEMVFKIN
jgi:TonB family protein